MFYIIGVVVVVLVIAGFLGLRLSLGRGRLMFSPLLR